MREELRVSEEFLARYNRPGPRYTSYPTAPVWNDSFGPAELRRSPRRSRRAKLPRLPVHALPFLRKPLPLLRLQRHHPERQARHSSLPRHPEERNRAHRRSVSRDRPVTQFHWGGGTPTYLTPAQIEDLFDFTREHSPSPPTPKSASKSIPASPAAITSKLSASWVSTASAWASRISTRSPEDHPPRPALRTDPRPDPIRSRPRLRQHQRRSHLRPPLPNRRNFRPHRRSNPRPYSRSHRPVQLRPRPLAKKAAGLLRQVISPKA